MIVNLRRLFYIYILLASIFFLQAGYVQAMGGREDRLDDARQLIEERRYNDAIAVISEVMKEQPRRFDEAEALMGEIREARAEYNRVYNHLIEVLDIREGEELNEAEAYEIIKRLEKLDADPNEASVAAFAQARRSIVFTVNDQRFLGIMTRGDQLLDEQKYIEAVDLYLSGFGLHRDRFEEDEYGEALIEQVDALIADIRQKRDEYVQLYNRLAEQLESFTAQGNSADPSWEPLKPAFSELEGLWQEVLQRAMNLEQIRTSIMDAGDADIPYLSTLRILVRGRDSSEKPNGFAGALERSIVLPLQDVTDEMLVMAENAFTEARDVYDGGDLSSSDALYESVIALLSDIGPFYSQWTRLHNQRFAMGLTHKTGPTQGDTQSDRYYLQAMEAASRVYRDSIAVTRQLNELQTADKDTDVIESDQESLRTLMGSITGIEEELASVIQEQSGYAAQGISTERALAVLNEADRSFQNQLKRAQLIEGSYVFSAAERQYDLSMETIEKAEKDIAEADRFIAGVETVLPGSDTPVMVKYPQRSVELLRQLIQDIQPVRTSIEEMVSLLNRESSYIQEQEEVRISKERGSVLLQRILSFTDQARSLLIKAESLNRNADIALSEGEIRLQQARSELDNDRFEIAREKLEQAGYSFSESLNFREDPEVRRLIDELIPSIAERILFRQNQEIITEVRELISRGRELFFTEEFISAEQVLKRAQSKWRLTHTEDDPEIELWLTRVDRALETTSGVVIKEDDPLYADMMQVLNLARDNFQQGEDLYARGDERDAFDYFRQAERKIEYIKEPFPNNQAASVLYLRILQYIQPQDFETIFRDRFQESLNKLGSSPEEAYRELQVLQEIRGDYPGLADAIYRAEIATGIRQPPPDPQKLARARELYGQAERIVEQDIRAQFPIALTYLNEAIKLDPDYRDAILLKDRVQTGQGGQVSVVLSSVDQQRLRQAENLFIDGRYFEASALVEQLWQNPENRSNPKLVELRRRIESQL